MYPDYTDYVTDNSDTNEILITQAMLLIALTLMNPDPDYTYYVTDNTDTKES